MMRAWEKMGQRGRRSQKEDEDRRLVWVGRRGMPAVEKVGSNALRTWRGPLILLSPHSRGNAGELMSSSNDGEWVKR